MMIGLVVLLESRVSFSVHIYNIYLGGLTCRCILYIVQLLLEECSFLKRKKIVMIIMWLNRILFLKLE